MGSGFSLRTASSDRPRLANALGVEPGDLTPEVFRRNPLILRTRGGEWVRSVGAAGFSTFGEQFGAVHVNQTMVGVAFGG